MSHIATLELLPSNVSQCTSTTDSQEHALNCTLHKILLTVFTINQLIPLLSYRSWFAIDYGEATASLLTNRQGKLPNPILV